MLWAKDGKLTLSVYRPMADKEDDFWPIEPNELNGFLQNNESVWCSYCDLIKSKKREPTTQAVFNLLATHYGHAGRVFLEKLTFDQRDFCALLERFKALPIFKADNGEGQDKRAAGRFALLALAGELATEYGITGWAEGESSQAAAGFMLWRGLRGRGNDERRQILDRVASFIERHGDSRFSDMDKDGDSPVRDRAGWWHDPVDSGRVYLFTAEGMREAMKGFDFKRALDVLQDHEALPGPGTTGERSRPYRIGGRVAKLYPINSNRVGCDHGA